MKDLTDRHTDALLAIVVEVVKQELKDRDSGVPNLQATLDSLDGSIHELESSLSELDTRVDNLGDEFDELTSHQCDQVADIVDDTLSDRDYVDKCDVEQMIDEEISTAVEGLQQDISTLWQSRLSYRLRKCWDSQRKRLSTFLRRFRKGGA